MSSPTRKNSRRYTPMTKYKLGLAVYAGAGRWENERQDQPTHRYIACGIQNKRGFTGFVTDYSGGGNYQDEWLLNGKLLVDPDSMSCDDPDAAVNKVYPGLAAKIRAEVAKIAKWDDAAMAYRALPKFVKFYKAAINGDGVYAKGPKIDLPEIGLSSFD
jgi:hypothetical protein